MNNNLESLEDEDFESKIEELSKSLFKKEHEEVEGIFEGMKVLETAIKEAKEEEGEEELERSQYEMIKMLISRKLKATEEKIRRSREEGRSFASNERKKHDIRVMIRIIRRDLSQIREINDKEMYKRQRYIDAQKKMKGKNKKKKRPEFKLVLPPKKFKIKDPGLKELNEKRKEEMELLNEELEKAVHVSRGRHRHADSAPSDRRKKRSLLSSSDSSSSEEGD